MNNKRDIKEAGKMRGRVILAAALCLTFVAAIVLPAEAQWIEDGTIVAAYDGYQGEQHMVPDGNGGAFLAWTDDRPGPADAVFAQRFDAYGNALWAAGGVPVTMTISYNQQHTNIVPVGDGGAIVVYAHEYSAGNYNIRAQRLDAEGNMLWTVIGISIVAAVGDQTYPVAVPDDEGGAVIAWRDDRMGNRDVYAQRVDSSGVVQWTANGVAICGAAEDQFNVVIVSDGNHGGIISWTDFRAVVNSDIYAQRVRYDGVTMWTPDGVPVCTGSGHQNTPQIITDDSGGAIVTWNDYRAVTHTDIYAQRIDAGGWMLWAMGGVAVCVEASDQGSPQLVPDGSGGAVIAWHDFRAVMFAHWNIYAQRLDLNGAAQWTSGGVVICDALGDQEYPAMAPSTDGGAIIAWEDDRYGNYDVYAQKVDGSGNLLWETYGIPVSDVSDMQVNVRLVEDEEGGAIFSWMDNRPIEYNWDLYALRMDSEGYWGYPSAYITSVEDVPYDEGLQVTVTWDAARIDDYPYAAVTEYDVYRSILSYPDYTWTLLGTVEAFQLASYSYTDVTTADSNLVDPNYHHYRIVARSSAPAVFWTSPPDSGYSVDNVNPPPPVSSWVDQNYPNPFNPTTTIQFGIRVAGRVTLRIYDAGGRLVAELINEHRVADRYEEVWDGRDRRGNPVASGVYFYSLTTVEFEETKKMLLLR
ncbi:MAG: T9SS type A sorting domain-containing protein [Bacteroidales bacterium]|nr:T9SS type A sorting domain-containing protein [Candidatus Latescibacterota bacterium]